MMELPSTEVKYPMVALKSHNNWNNFYEILEKLCRSKKLEELDAVVNDAVVADESVMEDDPAIEDDHTPAFVPLPKQKRFWSRKSIISQNVMVAASFEGLFTYILVGAEGSIIDATYINTHSIKEGIFNIPQSLSSR
ncbi:hypothetical protein E4U52_008078 [Claviceps spartinae]|nr:hypothetical protein E4U52_008078 [Claviceps spartinae]